MTDLYGVVGVMRFSIAAWHAVSPYHHEEQDWRLWVENGQSIAQLMKQDSWDLSFLPAMKRRRLSTAARQAFAAAWPVLPEASDCPVVFVSHDGEVNRSFQLWHDLLNQEGVSPTSFALSVHNAIVGQWSLLRQDVSESVAISARGNGLEVGVTEACGLLNEGEERVLVIVLEDPIEQAEIQAVRAPFSFSLALLLTKGEDCCLHYDHTQSETVCEQDYYSSSLLWIAQKILEKSDWQQNTASGAWHWQVTHANN